MTDRIKGLIVTLDHDIRDDDIQPLADAIRLLQNVVDVSLVKADFNDSINRARVDHEWRERLIALLKYDRP